MHSRSEAWGAEVQTASLFLLQKSEVTFGKMFSA